MKKFNLRKWMKEQKELPKNKRSLTSNPPIKNKTKQPLSEQMAVYWTGNPNHNWWEMIGGSPWGGGAGTEQADGPFIEGSGNQAGHLYACDNAGNMDVYRLTSVNGTDTNVDYGGATAANNLTGQILDGEFIQEALHAIQNVGTFSPAYYNNQVSYDYESITGGSGTSLDKTGITPVDIIHYCKDNNGASLSHGGSTFVCPNMDTPCGGLHAGDAQHNAVGATGAPITPQGLGDGVCSDPQHTNALDCLTPGTCHLGPANQSPPGQPLPAYDNDPIGCYLNGFNNPGPPLFIEVAGNGGNYQSDNTWTCPDASGGVVMGNGTLGATPFANGIYCINNSSFYNLSADWSVVPPWYTYQFTQTQVYTPSLGGYAYALDNCNGPDGVCDDSYYVFGCMDTQSIDFNDPITDIAYYDPSIPELQEWNGSSWVLSTTPLGEWYGGLTGAQNQPYGLWEQDATTFMWSATSPAAGNTQGCGNGINGIGIPDPNNTNCCNYIGCPSRTNDVDYPMNNSYGVWDPAGAASYVWGLNNATTGIVPTIINTNNTDIDAWVAAPRVIGCPKNGSPEVPELDTDAGLYDCCQVVGCPKDYETAHPGLYTGDTSKYGGTQYEENDEPFTWEVLGALDQAFYDNDAYIGCDSALILTGGAATSIPDQNDYSCCTPHMNVDPTVGCMDPDALNYNMSSYGSCSDSQYIDDVACGNAGETWYPAGTTVTATGCLMSDPASPWLNLAGDPTDNSCCNYEGCPDANQHPTITPAEYLATNAGHFSISTLTLNVVNVALTDGEFFELDPADGKFGCDDGTGDVHGTTYLECCEYPLFGCTDPVSHLYDVTLEGCPEEYTIGSTNFWIKSTTPDDTTCCNYLGCFDTIDGTSSDAANFGVTDGQGWPTTPPLGGYDASLFPAGGYNMDSQTGGVGGVNDCIVDQTAAEASPSFLLNQTNYSCCMYDGCMDNAATNYDSLATIPCNSSGFPWEVATYDALLDDDCCSYGGCMDSQKNLFRNHDTGQDVEYYLASNYNPDASMDCANIVGGADYSCCKYYTCKVGTADNFNYTPGPSANFFVQDDGATYQPSNKYIHNTNLLDIGCPRIDYDMGAAVGFDFQNGTAFPSSWAPDYASDWCCAYKGCPDDDTPARNFTGDMVVQYPSPEDDPTKLLWGCNIDDPQFSQQTWDPAGFGGPEIDAYYSCCAYEGCSDYSTPATNLLLSTLIPNLPYLVTDEDAFHDNQMTCDAGFMNNPFGVDLVLNPNNHTCCEYEGCSDVDALNFIEVSQGIVGCPNLNTGVWTPGDKSCCVYVGCPDNGGQSGTPTQGVAAYNYGTFEFGWNNPTVFNSAGISDPTYVGSGGTFGCSLDGTNIEDDATGNPEDYYSCCQYVVGCNDNTSGPLNAGAIAGTPFPSVSYGIDCPTCNYTPNATACFADSTDPGAGWTSNSVDDGVLTNSLAFGILSIGDTSCCNYQWGCELDLAASAGLIGNYDQASYVLGNYGCESTSMPGTIVDNGPFDINNNERYACCGTPIVYGCTDTQGGAAYDALNQVGCSSGYPGASGGAETIDPNIPSAYPFWCCDYSDSYSCGHNEGISITNEVAANFSWVGQIDMPGLINTNIYTGSTGTDPSLGTLVELNVHTFTGQLQPDTLEGNVNWNTTSFELDTEMPGYTSWVSGVIGGQPPVASGGQTPYWCKEVYKVTDVQDSNAGAFHVVIHNECYSYYSVGCNGFPGSPSPSSYDCCMYDYGCPTPGADNYNMTWPVGQRGEGCSSDSAEADYSVADKWRGLPDDQDTSCCEWTNQDDIGCKDPVAHNYKNTAIGCQSSINSAPDDSDTSCCDYFYLCNDPLASNYGADQSTLSTMMGINGHTWGTAPGCDSTQTAGIQPQNNNCDSAGGSLSCYPDSADVSCCEYDYGCNQPNDGTIPFIVGTYGIWNFYHIGHKGCRSDGDPDTAPQWGITADPTATGCCYYAYGCPSQDDPATNNPYLGCDPTGSPYAGTGYTTPTGDMSCCSETLYGCNNSANPLINVTNPSNGNSYDIFPQGFPILWQGYDNVGNPGCADMPMLSTDSGTCEDTTGAAASHTDQISCEGDINCNGGGNQCIWTWAGTNYWFATYSTLQTGSEPLADTTNIDCCLWQYACADINAEPDGAAGLLNNAANPGCNDGIPDPTTPTNLLTLVGGTVTSVTGPITSTNVSYAIPNPANTDCCNYNYNYGCDDDSGNYGGSQANNYDPAVDGCDPGDGSSAPTPGDYSCCLYNYGCKDPEAAPVGGANVGFQYYDPLNLGCHPESDYQGTNTGIYPGSGTIPYRDFEEQVTAYYNLLAGSCYEPSGNLTIFTTQTTCLSPNNWTFTDYPSAPNPAATECCKYDYVCPVEGGSNWDNSSGQLVVSPHTSGTPVTNIGCHPDNTTTTNGPDFGQWVNGNTQCCIYQYACADTANNTAVIDTSYDAAATTNANNPGCNDDVATDYTDYTQNVNLGGFNTLLNSTTPSNTTPWGSFNYGTNPPDPSNYNCCSYGCDSTNSTGNNNAGNAGWLLQGSLTYWPGAIDWSIFPQIIAVGSGDNAQIYGHNSGDWPGGGQEYIDPPLDEVCCIDTFAAGYDMSDNQTWTYINTPLGCSCDWQQISAHHNNGTALIDDENRWLQVSCDGKHLCNKCCLNIGLAGASIGNHNPSGNPFVSPTFYNGSPIISQIENGVAPSVVNPASGTGSIIAYDVNNQDSWPYYMIPPYIYQETALNNPALADPLDPIFGGCHCLDNDGNLSPDIIEIDCWSGWRITEDVPCLPDMSGDNAYGAQMYSTQLYAALGELYGLSPGVVNPDGSFTPGDGISSDDPTNPYPDPADMDGNCGCHIYDDTHPEVINGNIPSSYRTTNCGPINHIDNDDVFCDTVKVWDPAANKCDWPCPRDWCWCKDRDITPVDPTTGYGIDTVWCCADPTTGEKTDCEVADPGIPYTNDHGNYTKIPNNGQLNFAPYNIPAYNPAQGSNSQGTFNPAAFYVLKDNWKGCDPVKWPLGATAFGHVDENGFPDGTVSTPWFGTQPWNEANSTSGDNGTWISAEPHVPIGPPQMIIPKSANCSNFYNEDETPKVFDANGFPTAYWTCGCPDIHNFPSDIHISKTNNNGYNTSNWVYPAGFRLTWPGAQFNQMTNPTMTHSAHGCPGVDNEPNPIAYENGSAATSPNTSYPVSDDWEDKVNCCMPLPDEDELLTNFNFGGCPVEKIEYNNLNYGGTPYVNDRTYLILPDHVNSTYIVNSGANLNPIYNGGSPENYILPDEAAGEYCVGPLMFANSAQGDPSGFHPSVNKYSTPPPNWPSGAVCPPGNGYYDVLNYDPNSEGCVKMWFDASGGTSLSNGTTGISNDASNPSQMDLSCCELGDMRGDDGLNLNDDPDWPGCTEATGGYYAWHGTSTGWMPYADGGATFHPDGVSIPRYGKNVINGQTTIFQGGGLGGNECGCNLQLALYISELQMGMWTAASPSGGSGALDVVTQIEEWLAPIYGGAVANSIGMSIPYGEGPTHWFSNQFCSNWTQTNGNIYDPQPIGTGVRSAGEAVGNTTSQYVFGSMGSPNLGTWEGYGCPMCSIPVTLTGMSSYSHGGDYYSFNKGGNNSLPSHMTPALRTAHSNTGVHASTGVPTSPNGHQPWNALLGTQWDPGSPHIVVNDSFFHKGCPDAQLNGLPNPLNLSCCEYEIISDLQQMEDYGCSPEMYGYEWDPGELAPVCEEVFTCEEAHNALNPMSVLQAMDPQQSQYIGYVDSVWNYWLPTVWPYDNCTCEDATDYIAGNTWQNQWDNFCPSIGYWCENNATLLPKKAGGDCGGTFSCKDVINFNEMLGGIQYTGENSTGLITLWPGSGIDEITNMMHSSITGEQENMDRCTPEDAQDWLLGPDGEPLGQMTPIEEPSDEPRLDLDSNEFPPLEEPSELTEQMVPDETEGTFNEQECAPLLGYYNLDFANDNPNKGPNQTELAIRQLRDLDPSDFDLKTITAEQCDEFFDGKQIQVDDEGVMSKISKELETAEKEGENDESIRLQRSLNYYKELSKYCNNLRPESCKELPEDSPWFISTSDECMKCANITSDTIKIQGDDIEKQRIQVLKDKEVDLKNTSIEKQDAIIRDNMPETTPIQGLDPNCQCCPNLESRILDPIETPEEKPIDTPTDEPTDKDVTPKDFTIPTDKEPEVKPEEEPLKTPEQLEYERLTAVYEKEKEELLSQGWTEGNIDPETDDPTNFDTRILVNQDKIEVTFYKEKPPTPEPTEPTEPEVSPDDFTLPTEPVVSPDDFTLPTEPPSPPAEEPKITREGLKRMVKNAIREIKKSQKNKR